MTDAELQEMEDDPDADEEEEEDDNDEPPPHVPFTKKIRGMPKKEKPKKEVATGIDAPKERQKKTKAPIGSNGRPKKRIVKTRRTKTEKGAMSGS